MNFAENREYIEDKFHKAEYDKSTGLDTEQIKSDLYAMTAEKDENEPEQIFRARLYAYILDNVQLSMNTKTPFPVMLNYGINYSYFAGQPFYSEIVYKRREKALKKHMPKDNEIRRIWSDYGLADMWNDFWHTVPDWNNIIALGFSGILKKAKDKKQSLLENGKYTDKNIYFLTSEN